MNNKIFELINSGITLNDTETQIVESYLWSKQKMVQPRHLNEWRAMAAVRGKGSDKQG